MTINKSLLTLAAAACLAFVTSGAAYAQSTDDRMGPGMMQGGREQQPRDRMMMQDGRGPGGAQGMDHCMMHDMMHGGMRSEMMGRERGRGMMMGQGMMGPGMMGSGRQGMGAVFGSRVVPVMNLSLDDVRGYLAMRLERLNNKRLKLGDLKSDDGTITADIVTVDNSLVQQLRVDRRTGAIDYVN
jgi:hypothetical protein